MPSTRLVTDALTDINDWTDKQKYIPELKFRKRRVEPNKGRLDFVGIDERVARTLVPEGVSQLVELLGEALG